MLKTIFFLFFFLRWILYLKVNIFLELSLSRILVNIGNVLLSFYVTCSIVKYTNTYTAVHNR